MQKKIQPIALTAVSPPFFSLMEPFLKYPFCCEIMQSHYALVGTELLVLQRSSDGK